MKQIILSLLILSCGIFCSAQQRFTEGSPGYEIYERFVEYIAPYRAETERLLNEWKLSPETGANREELIVLIEEARSSELSARLTFISENYCPDVSLHLLDEVYMQPFVYDAEELSAIRSTATILRDETGRAGEYLQRLENYSKYLRGSSFTDLPVTDEAGASSLLSEHHTDRKFTLIDFWASWCGGCRAGIPHVKEIQRLYGNDVLNVLSISIDSKESSWKVALEQENMDWPQFLATKEAVDILKENYGLVGIPLLLIISPEGSVLYSTWNPDELDMQLIKYVGDRF